MRRYFSFIVSFSILVVVIFLWDLIKLPYNQENLILGEYSNKKFNPLNEIVRFSLFVILPFLIYLVCYLKFNKKETYSINPKDKNYFLFKKEDKNVDELKYYFFFFVALISIEFFSLDFNRFIAVGDIYHEGTFLVAPLNYLITGKFFKSTFYDYGFVANNIGLISNFFLGYYTLGSIKIGEKSENNRTRLLSKRRKMREAKKLKLAQEQSGSFRFSNVVDFFARIF